jgi:hypothetical protein
VFLFSLQILSETVLILRRIQGDIIINVPILHIKYMLFFSALDKTLTFPTYLGKYSNIKVQEHPFSGS